MTQNTVTVAPTWPGTAASPSLADARQNLPVGAAYLREASALLRDRLLPAAQAALKVESDRLKADDDDAGADYNRELAVIAAAIVVLLATQAFIRRRTRRMVNPGLLAATALVLVVAVWTVLAGFAERADGTRTAIYTRWVGDRLGPVPAPPPPVYQ